MKQNKQKKSNSSKINLLAISKCPVGIASSYAAAAAIKAEAKKRGIAVKVEIQGISSKQNKFSQAEIKKSDLILITADIQVDTSKFPPEKCFFTPLQKVIYQPQKVFDEVEERVSKLRKIKKISASKIEEPEEGQKEELPLVENGWNTLKLSSFKENVYEGVRRIIPLIVGGGILISLAFLIDIGIEGPKLGETRPPAPWLKSIGTLAFSMVVPVLSAFISMSIAGTNGLASGLVAGLIANGNGDIYQKSMLNKIFRGLFSQNTTVQSGFLGGIAGGYLAGASVLFIDWVSRKIFKKEKKENAFFTMLIIPSLSILLVGTLMIIINIPLWLLAEAIGRGLITIYSNKLASVLVGVIIGLMMGFDLGGPINKIAYTLGITSINPVDPIYDHGVLMASVMAGGMVPPIGLALAIWLKKKKWSNEDLALAPTTFFLGGLFISEAAIPFAVRSPKKIIPATMLGGGLASGLSMLLKLSLKVPHGGIFVFPLVDFLWRTSGTSVIQTLTLKLIAIGTYGLIILLGGLLTAILCNYWIDPEEMKKKI